MKYHVNINTRVMLNSLLLLILFSCTPALSCNDKKSCALNSGLLLPECNEYDLVSGDLKTASIIYMDTRDDYPWYQDAVCAGKLISENKHDSRLAVIIAHNQVVKKEKFNTMGVCLAGVIMIAQGMVALLTLAQKFNVFLLKKLILILMMKNTMACMLS